MRVLLVSSDLIVVARVEGAVRQNAASLRTTAELDSLEAAGDATDLVMLDLNCAGADVGAVRQLFQVRDSPRPRIVAFGPHVQEDQLAAAKQAGCDVVISRGQFFAQVDAIISQGVV